MEQTHTHMEDVTRIENLPSRCSRTMNTGGFTVRNGCFRLTMQLLNWAFSILAAVNQVALERGWYVLPTLLPGWCTSSVIDWGRCSTTSPRNPSLPQVVILFFYHNSWTSHTGALVRCLKLQFHTETSGALEYFFFQEKITLLYIWGFLEESGDKQCTHREQRELYLFLPIVTEESFQTNMLLVSLHKLEDESLCSLRLLPPVSLNWFTAPRH